MTEFEIVDLGESWKEQELRLLGYTLGKDHIEELPIIVHETIATKTPEKIIAFREKNVYNYKYSGEVIAKYLIENGRQLKQKRLVLQKV